MRRVLEIVEAAEAGKNPYTVMVSVNVQSDTDDREAVKKAVQQIVRRLDGKSQGVRGGLVRIGKAEARKVIGTEKVTDWFAGMFA